MLLTQSAVLCSSQQPRDQLRDPPPALPVASLALSALEISCWLSMKGRATVTGSRMCRSLRCGRPLKAAHSSSQAPDPRELVLFMAQHKQAPSIPKARKNGWEAVDRYLWGLIDTAHFTKIVVPDADSWSGSNIKVIPGICWWQLQGPSAC